eukprot:scaffold14.g1224.t1
MKAVRWRSGGASASNPKRARPSLSAQVPGCTADLLALKKYYRRYHICTEHLNQPCVELQGAQCRFCQACGSFHPVSAFEGTKKSCRRKLLRHNERRSVKKGVKKARGRAPAMHQAAPVTPGPAGAPAAAPAAPEQRVEQVPAPATARSPFATPPPQERQQVQQKQREQEPLEQRRLPPVLAASPAGGPGAPHSSSLDEPTAGAASTPLARLVDSSAASSSLDVSHWATGRMLTPATATPPPGVPSAQAAVVRISPASAVQTPLAAGLSPGDVLLAADAGSLAPPARPSEVAPSVWAEQWRGVRPSWEEELFMPDVLGAPGLLDGAAPRRVGGLFGSPICCPTCGGTGKIL